MSSVAVPKKMVPVPNVYGVEAFKEIKPEIVALHPIQHKETEFYASGQNRISFRVPAYSNALMDTTRSFLYMKLSATSASPTFHPIMAPGMPILSRMVVKTSSGLTLEDVTDMDALTTLLEALKPAEVNEHRMYGNGVLNTHSALTHTDPVTTNLQGFVNMTGALPVNAGDGSHDWTTADGSVEALYRFNFGIFSKHLNKFLPLFMADGGAGYAFDVDLYVSDQGLSTGCTLRVHSPIWYLHLVRMDEGLARRFNQMAVSGEEIRIPFTTWHTHRTPLSTTNMIAYIHENATNFKKILTAIRTTDRLVKVSGTGGKAVKQLAGFTGGVRDDTTNPVVTSYNYRVGVQHVYNEPVMESVSNTRTFEFVRSAMGVSDDVVLSAQVPEFGLGNNTTSELAIPPYERGRWCAVASFDYSPTDQSVIQGISTSNPVELSLKVNRIGPNCMVMNFCELAYDLVFKGGAIHYEEQKPGSQSVY